MSRLVQRLFGSATLAIAALTALAFFIAAILGRQVDAVYGLGFLPARMSGIDFGWPAVPAWLTPLSATLVHSGLLHLGFNLLILVFCGLAIERVVGRLGVIVLYLAGAFAAALAQWAVDPLATIPMVGASGAISAIVGAYSLSFGRAKALTRSPRVNRWINAAWLLAAWVVIQLLTGIAAGAQGVMLAIPAHIGGFIAGLLLQRPLLLWRYRSA